MSDVAIRVEGLGKMYRIGAETERTDTFRDALVAGAKGVARNIGLLARGRIETSGPTEEFWALRDVDFEIKRGEAVGIIGRNGAGKSTLLKVLSRITEPTTGRITMNGRVASLLEVGTGFHPELTGRENIFLNGAIIGMTRAEIRRKFDEIVDFAGVEKFLDTPVKRYSSGMGVRLGFAVAAHLEPEILIVDEVLAVGDTEFQKKCLGKMNEVAGDGRTVLFVSHNMAAVANLCRSGIYLREGLVASQGTTTEVMDQYRRSDNSSVSQSIHGISISIRILDSVEWPPQTIRFEISISAERDEVITDLAPLIYSDTGVRVAIADLRSALSLPRKFAAGRHVISCEVGPLILLDHTFEFGVYIASAHGSGNLYSLSSHTPAPLTNGIAPYPAAVRGFVGLNASATMVQR